MLACGRLRRGNAGVHLGAGAALARSHGCPRGVQVGQARCPLRWPVRSAGRMGGQCGGGKGGRRSGRNGDVLHGDFGGGYAIIDWFCH